MTATMQRLLEEYPSSDGQPMAESTDQCDWIVKIKNNLDWVFRDDPNVFIACDLLWYPVEGQSRINTAPDAMVVFGRPKGPRPSYMQFVEENIPPQVVFEILSPRNRPDDMAKKFDFYQKYGVEEYYLYDPKGISLQGWQRGRDGLAEIPNIEAGWRSPRLDIHMEVLDELVLTDPEGEEFLDSNTVREERKLAMARAEEEAKRAKLAMQRADRMAKRAEADGLRADKAEKRADDMGIEIERLKALLLAKVGG